MTKSTGFFSIRTGVEKYIDHLKECHLQYLINTADVPTSWNCSLGSFIISMHQKYHVDTFFDRDAGTIQVLVKSRPDYPVQIHSIIVTRNGDKWSRGDILDAYQNEKVGNIFLRDFSRSGFAGVG